MLALIAGTGDLPAALVANLAERPVICAMHGSAPEIAPDMTFRLEHLGSFLGELRDLGVSQICMVGAVQRPTVDRDLINAATRPLVPQIMHALNAGDDGALRAVIAIFEAAGFSIVAAQDIAPNFLPMGGIATRTGLSKTAKADAVIGEKTVADMGQMDIGQACVVRLEKVLVREGVAGTDAMVRRLATTDQGTGGADTTHSPAKPIDADLMATKLQTDGSAVNAQGGILFKAPKPDQDRRADLPVIGIKTARLAAAAGLAGIVIEADGVMVLDFAGVLDVLNTHNMFLWVRPRGFA